MNDVLYEREKKIYDEVYITYKKLGSNTCYMLDKIFMVFAGGFIMFINILKI